MYIWKKYSKKVISEKLKKERCWWRKKKAKMNKKREKKSKEDVTDYELKVPLVRDEQTQKKN